MRLFVCTSGLFTNADIGQFEYLRQLIGSLKLLNCEHITLNIHTNIIDKSLITNKQSIIDQFLDNSFVIQWNEAVITNNDYRELTWQHKNHLLEFLDGKYDLFLYTEIDYYWYRHHLEYFMQSRQKFLEQGWNFIPGFIRTEIARSNQLVTVDYQEPVNYAERPCVSIGNEKWYNPKFPYQGQMILDKDLAREHLDSPWSKLHEAMPLSPWGVWSILETANAGVIFHQVPRNFQNRILISPDYIDQCFLLHLPNKYVNANIEKYGTIPLNEFYMKI